MQREPEQLVTKVQDGKKTGIIKAPGDPSRPEKNDGVARAVTRRALSGIDADDRQTFGTMLAYLFLVILAFSTVGFAIRCFLFFAGFREVFW